MSTGTSRQLATGIPLTLDRLEPGEVEFVERFQSLGHSLQWIPKDRRTDGPQRATNDFVWLDLGCEVSELKSTSTNYKTIKVHILAAARRARDWGVAKDFIVLDLGDAELTPQLARGLLRFNLRQTVSPDPVPIRRLWVMSGNGARFEEIDLA